MVFKHVSYVLCKLTNGGLIIDSLPSLFTCIIAENQRYYQCLAFFPSVYNYFFEKWRKKTTGLFLWTLALLVLNIIILMTAWFSMRYLEGYNHFDVESGEPNPVSLP